MFVSGRHSSAAIRPLLQMPLFGRIVLVSILSITVVVSVSYWSCVHLACSVFPSSFRPFLVIRSAIWPMSSYFRHFFGWMSDCRCSVAFLPSSFSVTVLPLFAIVVVHCLYRSSIFITISSRPLCISISVFGSVFGCHCHNPVGSDHFVHLSGASPSVPVRSSLCISIIGLNASHRLIWPYWHKMMALSS